MYGQGMAGTAEASRTGAAGRKGPDAASTKNPGKAGAPATPWTFLTNHTHVLLHIAAHPDARMREVATEVGITERAVQRIVAELEAAGYLKRERDGRRNHYQILGNRPLRHPIERHTSVDALIRLVLDPQG
jgi:hypothetical protein